MKKTYTFLASILLFASLSLAQTPSYVPTAGLVGWYPFTGNANDLSGSNNNGTDHGATLTTDRFNSVNSAYYFDGVSSYINSTSAPFLNPPFSISAWVNADTIYPMIVATFGDATQNNSRTSFATFPNGGLALNTSGANAIRDTSSLVSVGGWHHVVLVCTGYSIAQTSYYVDNVLYQSNSLSGANVPFPMNNTYFSIGRDIGCSSCNSSYTHGKLDDIGLWNRALTQTEVTQLYTAPACTYIDTVHVSVHDTTIVTIHDTIHTLIHDTTYTALAVTDTLVINAHLTGILPPNNVNELRVYPNPAKSDLFIDCGNYTSMSGYTIKVINSIGQTVYSTLITQQQYNVNLSTWSGHGIYVLTISDQSNTVVSTKEIVLQ